jgi:ribonuclease III
MPRLDKILTADVMQDPLYEEALTHRSLGKRNYERLEFLGDSILNMVIAEALYRELPEEKEGILSRLRAGLVNKETLAELAHELDLGSFVRLGPGELKSGGFRRDSILADAMEAIIGAVYLLNGFDAARAYILEVYTERLNNLPGFDDLKDPKSRLQEYLQSKAIDLPVYELMDVTGKAHDQHFKVRCVVPDLELSDTGEGSSRKKAEQEAASRILEQLA